MRTLQASFAGGEIDPSMHARIDMAPYSVSCRTLLNFIVHPQGGASNRQGTWLIGEIPGPCRFIRFAFSSSQTYVLVFTNLEMRIIQDGGLVTIPGDPNTVAVVTSPYAEADLSELRFTQSLDTVFITHPSYAPHTLVRNDHHDWTFSPMSFTPSVPPPTGLTNTSQPGAVATYTYIIVPASQDGGDPLQYNEGTSSAEISVTAPNTWSGTVVLNWNAVPGADVYHVYRQKGAGGYVFRRAVTATTWTDDNSAGTSPSLGSSALPAPGGVSAVYLLPPEKRQYKYVVSWTEGGDESYPSAETIAEVPDPWPAGARVTLSWDAAAGVGVYNIYKNARGQWGWVGRTSDTEFIDDNINPDVSFGYRTPPVDDFTVAGGHPKAVALFQQRLVFGGTNSAPSDVWGSRIGGLDDFSISNPLRDDDPVKVRPSRGQGDEIQHLVPFGSLLVFTAGTEWSLDGANGSLTTSDQEFKEQSFRGSGRLPPIVSGNAVIFLERSGKVVRDFGYRLETDGYDGDDLSILARHLTKNRVISSWAYARDPDGIIWCCGSDGKMLSLTYHREHKVVAWCQHETDGEALQVESIPGESGKDDVYFCIKRNNKYYVEQLAERVPENGCFSDSSLSYSGAPATTFSGLSHLEGKAVSVLADGYVVPGKVVSGGQVVLSRAASNVIIGLPYTSRLETLDLDLSGDQGSNQGRRQNVSQLVIRMLESRGAWAGPSADKLFEVPFRRFENYTEPVALFTGDKAVSISPEWKRASRVVIEQRYPLPLTILALMAEVNVGG